MSEKGKKKLLYITETMAGGVLTYLADMSNALIDDFDITIAYGVRKEMPADFATLFDARVKFILVQNFTRAISPRRDMAAFWELRRIAAEVQPDIIHLHSSKAGALGRFALDGHATPIFYTPHGYSFLMRDASPVKRFIYRAIEAICGLCHATTISCSAGEHQETLQLTERATYVNNGINTQALARLLAETPAPSEHPFTVFSLGRISYQKGPALFNEVALACPEVHFMWIGDGDMRAVLTAPNIEVTGWADRRTALSYAQRGDMFILTSLWEGLPISLLEAMYMQKPCAVTNVIGNRDVIEHGRNGYICETSADFAAAIQAAKDGEANALAANAYEDIQREYNTNVMTEKYRLIYTKSAGGVQQSFNTGIHLAGYACYAESVAA